MSISYWAERTGTGRTGQRPNFGLERTACTGSMPFRVERDALPDGCRGAERVSWKVLQS